MTPTRPGTTPVPPTRAGGGERPVPVPDEQSAPYWAAAARHVLTVARCARCRAYAIPPDQICPACASSDPGFAFEPVSGRGIVRSWTVVRQSFLPGFDADLPFVLVDVELAEQADLRLIGRLLDGPAAPPRLGAPVRVAFEDLADVPLTEGSEPGIAIPAFLLADPEEDR